MSDEHDSQNNEFAANLQALAATQIQAGGVVREDGKEAKSGISQFSHGRAGDTMRLNPYVIEEEVDFNSRDWNDPENLAHIDWLAQDIANRGLRKPIEVRWDRATKKIFVNDGHCRLRAVKRAIEIYGAHIQYVIAMTSSTTEDLYERTIKTLSDNTGKRNSPLECARQVKKLMKVSGKSVEEVAKDLTRDLQTVKLWLEMEGTISPEIEQLVVHGRIALNTAYQTVKAHNFDTSKALDNITKALDLSAEQSAQGSKNNRALPRHLEATRDEVSTNEATSDVVSPITNKKIAIKKALQALFAGEHPAIDIDEGNLPGGVLLAMSQETFAQIREMLSL